MSRDLWVRSDINNPNLKTVAYSSGWIILLKEKEATVKKKGPCGPKVSQSETAKVITYTFFSV